MKTLDDLSEVSLDYYESDCNLTQRGAYGTTDFRIYFTCQCGEVDDPVCGYQALVKLNDQWYADHFCYTSADICREALFELLEELKNNGEIHLAPHFDGDTREIKY